MIAVRIELWPGGNPRGLINLETATVENTCPDLPEQSSYLVRWASRDGLIEATVRHNRSDGAMELARKALNALHRAEAR